MFLLILGLDIRFNVSLSQTDGDIPLFVNISDFVHLVSRSTDQMFQDKIPTLLMDLFFRLAFSSISDLIIAKVLLVFFPAYSNFFDILSDTCMEDIKSLIIESVN